MLRMPCDSRRCRSGFQLHLLGPLIIISSFSGHEGVASHDPGFSTTGSNGASIVRRESSASQDDERRRQNAAQLVRRPPLLRSEDHRASLEDPIRQEPDAPPNSRPTAWRKLFAGKRRRKESSEQEETDDLEETIEESVVDLLTSSIEESDVSSSKGKQFLEESDGTTCQLDSWAASSKGTMFQCSILGHGHVLGFDRRSQRGPSYSVSTALGTWWLVRTSDDSVSVQAEYLQVGSTLARHTPQSSIASVAIGGRFLNGHKLVIQAPCRFSYAAQDCETTTMHGGPKITWDGQEVLQKQSLTTGEGDTSPYCKGRPGHFCLSYPNVMVKYTDARRRRSQPGHFQSHRRRERQGLGGGTIIVRLPLKVRLVLELQEFRREPQDPESDVFRADMSAVVMQEPLIDHNNCRVKQCGQCGNFNGDFSDDVAEDDAGIFRSVMFKKDDGSWSKEVVRDAADPCNPEVKTASSLFNDGYTSQNKVLNDVDKETVEGCKAGHGVKTYDQAFGTCSEHFGALEEAENLLEPLPQEYFGFCVLDECFGGNGFALSQAEVAADFAAIDKSLIENAGCKLYDGATCATAGGGALDPISPPALASSLGECMEQCVLSDGCEFFTFESRVNGTCSMYASCPGSRPLVPSSTYSRAACPMPTTAPVMLPTRAPTVSYPTRVPTPAPTTSTRTRTSSTTTETMTTATETETTTTTLSTTTLTDTITTTTSTTDTSTTSTTNSTTMTTTTSETTTTNSTATRTRTETETVTNTSTTGSTTDTTTTTTHSGSTTTATATNTTTETSTTTNTTTTNTTSTTTSTISNTTTTTSTTSSTMTRTSTSSTTTTVSNTSTTTSTRTRTSTTTSTTTASNTSTTTSTTTTSVSNTTTTVSNTTTTTSSSTSTYTNTSTSTTTLSSTTTSTTSATNTSTTITYTNTSTTTSTTTDTNTTTFTSTSTTTTSRTKTTTLTSTTITSTSSTTTSTTRDDCITYMGVDLPDSAGIPGLNPVPALPQTGISMTRVTDCCDLCGTVPACTSFVWKGEGSCWLKMGQPMFAPAFVRGSLEERDSPVPDTSILSGQPYWRTSSTTTTSTWTTTTTETNTTTTTETNTTTSTTNTTTTTFTNTSTTAVNTTTVTTTGTSSTRTKTSTTTLSTTSTTTTISNTTTTVTNTSTTTSTRTKTSTVTNTSTTLTNTTTSTPTTTTTSTSSTTTETITSTGTNTSTTATNTSTTTTTTTATITTTSTTHTGSTTTATQTNTTSTTSTATETNTTTTTTSTTSTDTNTTTITNTTSTTTRTRTATNSTTTTSTTTSSSTTDTESTTTHSGSTTTRTTDTTTTTTTATDTETTTISTTSTKSTTTTMTTRTNTTTTVTATESTTTTTFPTTTKSTTTKTTTTVSATTRTVSTTTDTRTTKTSTITNTTTITTPTTTSLTTTKTTTTSLTTTKTATTATTSTRTTTTTVSNTTTETETETSTISTTTTTTGTNTTSTETNTSTTHYTTTTTATNTTTTTSTASSTTTSTGTNSTTTTTTKTSTTKTTTTETATTETTTETTTTLTVTTTQAGPYRLHVNFTINCINYDKLNSTKIFPTDSSSSSSASWLADVVNRSLADASGQTDVQVSINASLAETSGATVQASVTYPWGEPAEFFDLSAVGAAVLDQLKIITPTDPNVKLANISQFLQCAPYISTLQEEDPITTVTTTRFHTTKTHTTRTTTTTRTTDTSTRTSTTTGTGTNTSTTRSTTTHTTTVFLLPGETTPSTSTTSTDTKTSETMTSTTVTATTVTRSSTTRTLSSTTRSTTTHTTTYATTTPVERVRTYTMTTHSPSSQKILKVRFTIENMVYSMLDDTAKAMLREPIEKKLAETFGVDASDVSVTLASGSVKVLADILTTAAIVQSVTNEAVLDSVGAAVRLACDNTAISSALSGEMQIGNLEQSSSTNANAGGASSAPTPLPTAAPTAALTTPPLTEAATPPPTLWAADPSPSVVNNTGHQDEDAHWTITNLNYLALTSDQKRLVAVKINQKWAAAFSLSAGDVQVVLSADERKYVNHSYVGYDGTKVEVSCRITYGALNTSARGLMEHPQGLVAQIVEDVKSISLTSALFDPQKPLGVAAVMAERLVTSTSTAFADVGALVARSIAPRSFSLWASIKAPSPSVRSFSLLERNASEVISPASFNPAKVTYLSEDHFANIFVALAVFILAIAVRQSLGFEKWKTKAPKGKKGGLLAKEEEEEDSDETPESCTGGTGEAP